MDTSHTTRRNFLKAGGSATAAIAFPTIIPSSALGNAEVPPPSERIVMGGIGIGKQGGGDLGAFLGAKEVQYVAVCDVRGYLRNMAKSRVDKQYNNTDCKAYGDFRELLAREDIDAVHIATPDHWHALMVIEACRQGKDVYCQKPESLTLREGSLMVAAARNHGRVVSGGSQRVLQDYRKTVRECWGGEMGTIRSINVGAGPLPQPCNLPEEPVPGDMDWEMWLGPAPWAPYNGKRCSGDYSTSGNSWRSYVDYSGGGMTDWGAHHFGGATFAADVREMQPTEVRLEEEAGKKFYSLVYPNGLRITHNRPGKGNLAVEGTPGEKREPKPIPEYAAKGGIYWDFLACVKSRGKPFRDIELAINTMVVCHLLIVAQTLGRSLKWDAAKQCFPGDDEANRFLDRARREPWQL